MFGSTVVVSVVVEVVVEVVVDVVVVDDVVLDIFDFSSYFVFCIFDFFFLGELLFFSSEH